MVKQRRPKGPRVIGEPRTAPVLQAPIETEPAPLAETVMPDTKAPDAIETVATDDPSQATDSLQAVLESTTAMIAADTRAMAPSVAPVPRPMAVSAEPDPTPASAPAVSAAPAAAPAVAPHTPAQPAAAFQMVFSPEPLDLAEIGATITGYMRGEGEAAAAHLRALSAIRSPADLIRLQVGEMQRAADASLTCWSQVARKASRAFAYR